jgi:hypothetical protein
LSPLRFISWICDSGFSESGTRFEGLLARLPSTVENVILVEAKYRSDGRPVVPSEIERFARDVARIKTEMEPCIVQGFFVTNSKLSVQAIEAATKHQIRFFQHVPLIFQNLDDDVDERKEEGEEKNADRSNP